MINAYLLKILSVFTFCIPGIILRIILLQITHQFSIFKTNTCFLPNSIGCLIMGICQNDQLKQSFPLIAIGLTVGFCGSLTSFSSWLLGIVTQQPIESISFDLIYGTVLPLLFILIGQRIGKGIIITQLSYHNDDEDNQQTQILIQRRIVVKTNECIEIQVILILIGIYCMVVFIMLCFDFERDYLFYVIYGPIGAISRFILCDQLNQKYHLFQLGTFLSNLIGCIIGFVLQTECIEQKICKQIQFGLIGSLTTVSSWANDTISNYRISKLQSLYYNQGTLIVCLLVSFIILSLHKISGGYDN